MAESRVRERCRVGRRSAGSRRSFPWITSTAAILYLLFGVALAVIDQRVTTSITPLMLAALGAHPFAAEDAALRLTASFGVAALTAEGADPVRAPYQAADKLLYQAKGGGRNRVCSDESARLAERR